MNKCFKNILTITIMAFLLWYVAGHWEQLKALLKLSPGQLAFIYFLRTLSGLIAAGVTQRLINALKVKTSFLDMVRLHNTALLFNYIPMRFGTIFKANCLKNRCGLSYAHFATFFLYIIFLMSATTAVTGLTALVTSFGLAGYENKILAGVFIVTIIGSLFFILMPLPIPKGEGLFSSTVRNFLAGRSKISKKRKTLLIAAVLLNVNFLLAASCIGIIYHSMGKDIQWGGILFLGLWVMLFCSSG